MIRWALFPAMLCCSIVDAHPIRGGGVNRGCSCSMCAHNSAHNRGLQHDSTGRWYNQQSRQVVYAKESVRPEQAPTQKGIVESVMETIAPRADDLFFDLGCGDGRFIVAAAKRGARAIGIEIDTQQAELARRNVSSAHVDHLAVIRVGDARKADLRHATIVVMYLYPELVAELLPLCAGCRIVVSMEHPLPGVKQSVHRVGESTFYIHRDSHN